MEMVALEQVLSSAEQEKLIDRASGTGPACGETRTDDAILRELVERHAQ